MVDTFVQVRLVTVVLAGQMKMADSVFAKMANPLCRGLTRFHE